MVADRGKKLPGPPQPTPPLAGFHHSLLLCCGGVGSLSPRSFLVAPGSSGIASPLVAGCVGSLHGASLFSLQLTAT